jgi:hypothetical protein
VRLDHQTVGAIDGNPDTMTITAWRVADRTSLAPNDRSIVELFHRTTQYRQDVWR